MSIKKALDAVTEKFPGSFPPPSAIEAVMNEYESEELRPNNNSLVSSGGRERTKASRREKLVEFSFDLQPAPGTTNVVLDEGRNRRKKEYFRQYSIFFLTDVVWPANMESFLLHVNDL